MKRIDLHSHSTASDGTLTPSELVDRAVEKGLAALAITDHDTIGGIEEAKRHIEKTGAPLELIPGMELSSNVPQFPRDIHVLGYGFDECDPGLIADLKEVVNHRDNQRIIDILNKEGVPITLKDVEETGHKGILTRANFGLTIARLGYAQDIKDAFKKYVGKGRAAYIPRAEISPHRAVEIILKHRGIPVLAHPLHYGLSPEELKTLVGELTEKGLRGVECLYPDYDEEAREHLKSLAREHGLFITGGTDFHGAVRPRIDLGDGPGDMAIPYELLAPLKGTV
ncbi:MAG: PHP domain-containing protein [Spirochaetales bacterium]|nr:PHP domain-containing protein [Spirochaetales bacterium]